MNFITSLPISTNWKEEIYDFILVIVDWLTKMIYYKSVKITIDILSFGEVIIDVIVKHHDLFDSIATNKGFLFSSKSWLSIW